MRVVQSIVSALVGVSLVLAGAVLAVGLVSSPASATDMDCGDFSTQAAAQASFLANNPYSDPHNLDADGDLIACETLPCPCDFSTTPSPSPSPSVTPTGDAHRHGHPDPHAHADAGRSADARLGSGRARQRR